MNAPVSLGAPGRQDGSSRAARLLSWRAGIYASLVLWLAMAAGNGALFAIRPARHWPVLEAVEACQVASLVPVALLLDRVNHRSPASRMVTIMGIVAMSVAVAIDIGFVTELLAFGVGPVGGPVFVVAFLTVMMWLFAANALAWRARTLAPSAAVLGMATALTMSLLYPAWAIQIARTVTERESGLPAVPPRLRCD